MFTLSLVPCAANNGMKEKDKKGTLYIVSTPIGNLEDITLRALKVLKEADLIAAENRMHTRRLCNHFSINTKITVYNQHNRRAKGPELVERLKNGLNIALVTSAGTPGHCSSGWRLKRE